MQDINMITENDLKVGNWVVDINPDSNYLLLLKLVEYVERSPYYNQTHTNDVPAWKCLVVEASGVMEDFYMNESGDWFCHYEVHIKDFNEHGRHSFLYQPELEQVLNFNEIAVGYPMKSNDAKRILFDIMFNAKEKRIYK